MGRRALSDLPGWAEWAAQHREELTVEELDALLAWRVRVDEDGAKLPAGGFDWFLAAVRASLARARHRGVWPVPAPAPTTSPEPAERPALTDVEVEALLQRAAAGNFGVEDLAALAATCRTLRAERDLALAQLDQAFENAEEMVRADLMDGPQDPLPYVRTPKGQS